MELKYFKTSEFDSPDLPGSGQLMQEEFLTKLDKAREIAGIGFKINSGMRTVSHNLKAGGKSKSAHLTGYAADISVNGSRSRYIILEALISAGFNRIGVANSFIHVDCHPDLDEDVIWTY